jgi:hypothetical protein
VGEKRRMDRGKRRRWEEEIGKGLGEGIKRGGKEKKEGKYRGVGRGREKSRGKIKGRERGERNELGDMEGEVGMKRDGCGEQKREGIDSKEKD